MTVTVINNSLFILKTDNNEIFKFNWIIGLEIVSYLQQNVATLVVKITPFCGPLKFENLF